MDFMDLSETNTRNTEKFENFEAQYLAQKGCILFKNLFMFVLYLFL